jgi:hypothetical protein
MTGDQNLVVVTDSDTLPLIKLMYRPRSLQSRREMNESKALLLYESSVIISACRYACPRSLASPQYYFPLRV